MVADRLDIRLSGQAQKRGLIPRMPAGERLLGDIETWLRAEYPDELGVVARGSARTSGSPGAPGGARIGGSPGGPGGGIKVRFHPAAGPLNLTVDDDGVVTVSAETVSAGPGYHRFVGRVLERLGLDLAIDWSLADAGLAFADRPAIERAYLTWLGPQLAEARQRVRRGGRGIHVGLPTGTTFSVEEAVATTLGPRDEAWLDAAIADPRTAIEVTPWWSDATDGRYLLNRALTLMWLEVRWRRPAIESETDVLDEVHRMLARAYPLDPDLDYPWADWAEVISYRGVDDGMARQVIARAAQQSRVQATPARIGYRRAPVTIRHEGWALTVPGDFAERRTAEEWWGGGAGRNITLAATSTGTGAGRMTAQGFLSQVAGELGPDALYHEAGDIRGRARITTDASSGVEIGILEGFSAVTGSGAAIRIEFDGAEDYVWALEMWRSLAPG